MVPPPGRPPEIAGVTEKPLLPKEIPAFRRGSTQADNSNKAKNKRGIWVPEFGSLSMP